MTTIVVTIAVEDAGTLTTVIREIVIRDGGAYGKPLPPSRMRLKAQRETRQALEALVPDR
jgi:uncharacterized protein YheU (UPF0270 family)